MVCRGAACLGDRDSPHSPCAWMPRSDVTTGCEPPRGHSPARRSAVLSEAGRDELQLALTPEVGPLLRGRLLENFGSAGAVLAASLDELQQTTGVGPKIARRIVRSRHDVDVDEQLGIVAKHDLGVLLPGTAVYPRYLAEIHDPPGVLFTRGCVLPEDALAIAIVGTRRCTNYGRQQAERLAGALARSGITVVSGLARGIDTAAHRGALEAGGRTIAVLASGVLNVYPPENGPLSDAIAAAGYVASEAGPTMPPYSGMFPQRNRIISGLSLGTIVVEAAARSGALITARHACEQGREVFAVPGPVNSRVSVGPHQLLRDGAKLVSTIDDVLEELGPLAEQAHPVAGSDDLAPAQPQLNDREQQILQQIEPAGSSIEAVALACQAPIERVLATISVLESRRLVRKTSGNQVIRI